MKSTTTVTMTDTDPAQRAEYEPSPIELRMAAAIIFMPEIGHLTAEVTREIIARCARVAVEFGAQIDGGDSGE